MPKLNITIAGKKFSWTGGEREVAAIETNLTEFAASQKLDLLTYVTNVVLHFPGMGFRTDPNERQAQMAAIVCWILQQDTHHPEHPGRYRDYVPVYDFDFDLSIAGRNITANIGGTAWQKH